MADEVVLPLCVVMSLQEAIALTDSDQGPRRVRVLAVDVRHAQAVLDVIFSGAEQYLWELNDGNVAMVRQLARLYCKLIVARDAVLPMLDIDPASPLASRLLLKTGWALRHVARNIDYPEGPIYAAASSTGNLLRRHATHIHKETRQIDWLANNVQVLRDRIDQLIQATAILPGDGAAAGGQAVDPGELLDQ